MGDVLKQEFADRVRVCSYDRANTGQSEGGAPQPRRAPEVVSDLHDLLAAAKVPGPYLLVGNSAGGMLVQAYARSYPEAVSGVVAMNPVPPWDEWVQRAFPAMTKAERRGEIAYYGGEGSSETFDFRQISRAYRLDSRARRDPVPHGRGHQRPVRQSRRHLRQRLRAFVAEVGVRPWRTTASRARAAVAVIWDGSSPVATRPGRWTVRVQRPEVDELGARAADVERRRGRTGDDDNETALAEPLDERQGGSDLAQ